MAAPIAEIFRFDSLLARPDLWRLTSSDFGAAVQGSGFYWLDNQKNAARAGGAIKLQFMNHRIWEALVKFESNHISRVDLSFYNRGDANDSYVGHDSFTNLIRQICISLCSWTGVSGQILSSLPGPRRTIIHHGAWNKPPTRLELEWSAVWLNMKEEPFRAEFIRLKVFPITALTVAAKERPNLGRTPIDLKAHVQTATNGDIFLSGVPMVDQGEKGYCGAAVASRLMQYYGLDFDIHQAAMVADTSPTDGTTEDNIIESYKRIAQKTNLRFFTLRKFSLLINCDADNINPSVLNQFAADVARQINVGVPLVWGVRLGMVHEENLKIKTLSSHLRLIIGYNKKTGDILYSDSWGPGHECKRMPLKYAVRITNGLLVLKPDNL